MIGWHNFATGETDWIPAEKFPAWVAEDYKPYIPQGDAMGMGTAAVDLFENYIACGDGPSEAYIKTLERVTGRPHACAAGRSPEDRRGERRGLMAIDWWCAHCGRRRVTFKTKHCGGCGRSIWANRPAGVWPNTAVPRTDQTKEDR